jgi:hypothetical protein
MAEALARLLPLTARPGERAAAVHRPATLRIASARPPRVNIDRVNCVTRRILIVVDHDRRLVLNFGLHVRALTKVGPTCGLFDFQLIGNADQQQTRVRDPDD